MPTFFGRGQKLRPEGISDRIRDWEIDKGGWRYDENNDGFSLTWEQLLEYEKQNDAIKDDDAFFEWYREFRKKEGIAKRTYGGSGSYSGWSDNDDDWGWGGWKKKGKSLSSYWAGDVYKGWNSWGGSTKSAHRLALVLKAIKTVIRVVDDNVPPMNVAWSRNGGSYTSFEQKDIHINPEPVMKPGSMSDDEIIDICTGFGLHEAGHSQHSREPYGTLTKPDPVRPLQVGSMLLNIVEDNRIEAAVADDFPGFAGYFVESLAYMWKQGLEHLPKTYGPDVDSKMKTVIAVCRWPEESKKKLTDPSFAAEIGWWRAWQDDYLSGRVKARETVERGIAHLGEQTEEEKKSNPGGESQAKGEMDQMTKDEQAAEAAGEALKQLIDRLTKEMRERLKMSPCSGDHDHGLDGKEADEVERLVGEDLTEDKVFIKTPHGSRMPPLYIRKPLEDDRSRRMYIGKPGGVLARLKAALVFRQELPRYTNRLLKSGHLDDEELWRWKDNDYRVFEEEVIQSRPKAQLSLLVDMSGSMAGQKLRTAQELAQLFVWALRDMDGVTTKVFGHTGDLSDSNAEIYRLWEDGDSLTRLGLITSMQHGDNYDGYAIEWVVREVMNRGEEEEQRIVIVLSDGYPAGNGYGHTEAQNHVRTVTDWAEKQGVRVIQIAIDPSIEPARQARMFKEWIQYTTTEELPRKLQRLLEKYT